MKLHRLKKWLLILLIIYLSGGVALYFLQDAILFHPVRLKRDHKYDFNLPHQDISVPINKTDTLNLVQFQSTAGYSRGVVLYFHGNKKNISWYAKYPPFFTRWGYDVIIIDYPGFGKSKGKFTEKILYDWADLVYNFAKSRFSPDSIIIYGKSMGTGIAAHLASGRPCKRVILETPYFDMPSVISSYLPIYPVNRLLHYQLPIYRYLPFIKSPVSIIHGTDDAVIRYSNASRLIPYMKKTDEFITVKDASHNDLYEYPLTLQKIDSLLRTN